MVLAKLFVALFVIKDVGGAELLFNSGQICEQALDLFLAAWLHANDLLVLVALFKFVDTALSIDELLSFGKEGMRSR